MIPLAKAFLHRLLRMPRVSRSRPSGMLLFAGLLTVLASCGDGDGPAGSTHPTLAVCDRSRQGSQVSCEEYRNITDGDWPALDSGCETTGNNNKNILTENGTCSSQNTKGACKEVAPYGTAVTTWYYKCSAAGESACAKQPSQIQTECQSGGGTYIPPDEAG